MPRFFFDLFNGHGEIRDEEGSDFSDQAAAKATALASIRSMVCEDAGNGIIDLTGRIDIKNPDRALLMSVTYFEAFQLHLPPNMDRSNG